MSRVRAIDWGVFHAGVIWLVATALCESGFIALSHEGAWSWEVFAFALALSFPWALGVGVSCVAVRMQWLRLLGGVKGERLNEVQALCVSVALCVGVAVIGMALLSPVVLVSVRTEWMAGVILGVAALGLVIAQGILVGPAMHFVVSRILTQARARVTLLNRVWGSMWTFFATWFVLFFLCFCGVMVVGWSVVRELSWWVVLAPGVAALCVGGVWSFVQGRSSHTHHRSVVHLGVVAGGYVLCCALSVFSYLGMISYDSSGDVFDESGVFPALASSIKAYTDWDNDGASSWLDGGDCRPDDPKIGPLAFDEPGDGIDQDCVGGDSKSMDLVYQRGEFSSSDKALLKNKPHVIFITTDALSYSHTNMGGYTRDVTPELAKFAQHSTVFEQAYSSAPSTRLALPGIFMGQFNAQARLDDRRTHPYGWSDDNETLAEKLKEGGWRTVQVVGANYFTPKKWPGLGQGFELVDTSALKNKSKSGHTSKAVSDAVIKQIERHDSSKSKRPLFLWAHYFDHHSPFKRPSGSTKKFGDNDVDLYDEELRYTDEHIGRVLSAIQKRWKPEDYIIVFTSDHGEAFKGRHHHGYTLRSVVLDVPLIIQTAHRRGEVIKGLASHLDIFPTLLDLLGLTVDKTEDYPGESLAPVLLESGREPQKDYVLGAYYVPESRKKGKEALRKVSVRTDTHYVVKNLKRGKFAAYVQEGKDTDVLLKEEEYEEESEVKQLERLLDLNIRWIEKRERGLKQDEE